MDEQTTYDEHFLWLQQQSMEWGAELCGFIAAVHLEEPNPQQYANERCQRRYVSGFHDGKAKLMVDEVRR